MNQRKRQVLDSALQLFIEKGFHNTSIQDILSKAMISKGTFYNYFSSKNECFIAILEQNRYEASLRRHEMLIGKDSADEEILLEQVIVLIQINKEQNLISIFEGIFHSNDKELQQLLSRYRMLEIDWFSNRIIDIFSEDARPYALELSVLFFGMVHHLSMTYRALYGTSLELKKVVCQAFRNIKAILPEMIKNNKVLISQGALQLIDSNTMYQSMSKETIIEKLIGFLEELNYDDEYLVAIQFTNSLLDEFQRETLRFAVIETLLKPFRDSLNTTSHKAESVELANMMWYFIKNGHKLK